MTFANRHEPQTVQQLVFKDPAVASIIADYASGVRTQHLLLHGPAGSGKSIAAQIILNTYLANFAGTVLTKPINPKNYSHQDFDIVMNTWNVQLMNRAPHGLTIIDEVDFFSSSMKQKLRAFIDGTQLGTIIATTNNLHNLDEPFKDRFRQVFVERPSSADWVKRAQDILAIEGVNLNAVQAATLLKGFEGSARSLINFLEDAVLTLKASPTQAASLPLSPPTLQTLSGKTPINGYSQEAP